MGYDERIQRQLAMTRQAVADATEKSLASQLGMVVFIALLMSGFIYYFLKNEDNYVEVAVNTAFSSFSSQLLAIHSQWLMTNKPAVVILPVQNEQQNQREITVNDNGWPDTDVPELPCQLIWRQVMEQPLKIMNYPVSVIEIKSAEEIKAYNGKICRYFLSDAIYFEYNSANGKVTKPN